jgi:o-succinylbenzoate synthase
MKLARADIAAFSLALRAPLVTSSGTVTHRRGFLLRVHDEHGLCGLGEASPASWVDGEPLEETERSLRELVRFVAHRPAPDPSLSPAARSAFDMSLLDLEARQEGVEACRRLGGSPRPIGLAALLGEQTESGFARELAQALSQGFRCFKLKVGADPAVDLSRLSRVRREGGEQSAIRLDANRAWGFDEARRALEAFRAFSPEHVEEPLKSSDPAELAHLRAEAGVAIAADESLRGPQDLERLAGARSVDTVVLKLARLGGPRPTLSLARRASELGLRVVLTDSIDSAIGRAAVLHVACALPAPIAFVGLAGSRLLASDATSDAPRGPRLEPAGPGLGVTLAPHFEKSLRWHD